ncbi:MAG: hypothetical protein HQK51_04340 [Oligoflexia bacterium]|nr:hypothetical protein [Oligoflexia bacterium]
MKTFRRRGYLFVCDFVFVAILLFKFTSVNCYSANIPKDTNNTDNIANDFRLIFDNLLRKNGSNLDIKKIIYLPPSKLLQSIKSNLIADTINKDGSNSQEGMKILDVISRNFSEIKPVDIYYNSISSTNKSLKGLTESPNEVENEYQSEYQNESQSESIEKKIDQSLLKLKKNPITIVLLTGMFTEFTKYQMFHEIFTPKYQKKSLFYKKWIKKLNYRKSIDVENDLLRDQYQTLLKTELDTYGESNNNYNPYNAKTKMGYKNAAIEELINISSFSVNDFKNEKNEINEDSGDNQEVVRVILLQSPLLSLETLEDYRLMSRVYTRRLNKVFSILGETPSNLYLLGYSRGVFVGLEMLKTYNEWQKSVRGVISLSGVLYGTDYSDEGVCHISPTAEACKQLKAIMNMAASLRYIGQYPHEGIIFGSLNFLSRLPTIAYNMYTIVSFIKNMLVVTDFSNYKSNTNNTALNDKINNFFIKYSQLEKKSFLNPRRVIEDAIEIIAIARNGVSALKTVDPQLILYLVFKIGLEGLHLNNIYFEHDLIIKKLRIVCEHLYKLLYQISTKDRLEWWRTSNLPTKDINYYSITATMFENNKENNKDQNQAAEEINPYYYPSVGLDYLIQQYSYKLMAKHYGFYLNDSKVVMHKAVFWNELNAALNPYYIKNPLKTTWLGIAGVDHWGIAFGSTFNLIEQQNKFPREELFKALSLVL